VSPDQKSHLPYAAAFTGRTGLYLRVIREGEAQAGDLMTLVERPHPEWSVARMSDLLIAGAASGAILRAWQSWRASRPSPSHGAAARRNSRDDGMMRQGRLGRGQCSRRSSKT